MQKKAAIKLIILTPLVALILSTSAFFIENYPQSYDGVVNFIDKKIESVFKEDIPPLEIDEDELLGRLEKRMKRTTSENGMSQETAMNILSSTVRVTAGTSMGTGVIIFSEEVDQIHYSYVVTNSHVVKKYDEVQVERFAYLKQQTISSITSYPGRVISNNANIDLALIQVVTPDSIGRTAIFETSDLTTNLTLYQSVYVAGCALAKPPLVTRGNVAHITTISTVVTAFSIFGSSGGGVYTTGGDLVGVVRGVSMVHVPPRGLQIPEPNLTHMIPGPLVRSWLLVGGLSFITDPEALLTHQNFLDQQKELVLEQQEKKAARELEKAEKKAKRAKKK